jgi:hypothetical protein
MMKAAEASSHLRIVESSPTPLKFATRFERIRRHLGIPQATAAQLIATLPFTPEDTTAGAENELQACVVGPADKVDLPITIFNSNYFKNITRKALAGDTPRHAVTELEKHLSDNSQGIWENSWVRLPCKTLSTYAREIFDRDLLADKRRSAGPLRCDVDRFFLTQAGEKFIRIPVSYLLKLALADAVGTPATHPLLRSTAKMIMEHFLSDNTSPETYSFYPVSGAGKRSVGQELAAETLSRYLMSQLLVQYANQHFDLTANGQKALIFFSPHPLARQKKLNDLIPDSFYRELFMSPCLSGWDRGVDKHRYMGLCHQVLSRSQLNGIAKLKEAGIITRNLIVLPNISNISLANNGTHVSLGSRKLTQALGNADNHLTSADEKQLGDLVIKIFEHFLPLFVGTYSADPYRIDFWNFHPEKVLGFLPHELDFTHLRMIWRRWKKKARLRFCGQALTPFGPQRFDRILSRLLHLRGDWVTDFRLIDYLVALLSSSQSAALDGSLDSAERLKTDLAAMGVFDEGMPLYLLYRLRQFEQIGFSGFEGRYYSLFETITTDMRDAVNLQTLLTALAYKYILVQRLSHADIPDEPTIESERRQIFFGTAIGLPTFFVHSKSTNRFLVNILKHTKNTRASRRYPGYTRVHNLEYCRALVALIKADGQDLIEMFGLQPVLDDLAVRLAQPAEHAASGKLMRRILDTTGSSSPFKLSGEEFNTAAETCYRESLKGHHLREALDLFKKELAELDSWPSWRNGIYNQALLEILAGKNAVNFLAVVQRDLLAEKLSPSHLRKLIHLLLLCIHMNHKNNKPRVLEEPR